MSTLKRVSFGICIGLFMMFFRNYFWSFVRPIFFHGQVDSAQKTLLLTVLVLAGVCIAIVGILYERREILRMASVNAMKRSVQIGLLIALIIIGSLAYSVAFEF
jgi:uncharacterized membrane protein YidH (DUF202 family)